MPTYGYECTECNHTFEIMQKMSDDPITKCDKCGGSVRRVIYPVGIAFKGSGFHINDYGSKCSSSSSKSDSPACAGCPNKSE